jgi:hypothetical protein
MLKSLLVACAALLIPSTVLAEVAEKNLCLDIGPDPVRCALAPQCFFDSTDNRCEWIHPVPDLCNNFSFDTTGVTCVTGHPTCFWDPGDQRCETRAH